MAHAILDDRFAYRLLVLAVLRLYRPLRVYTPLHHGAPIALICAAEPTRDTDKPGAM